MISHIARTSYGSFPEYLKLKAITSYRGFPITIIPHIAKTSYGGFPAYRTEVSLLLLYPTSRELGTEVSRSAQLNREQRPLFFVLLQTIDGVDLHLLDLWWWRSQLGVVQEDPDFTTGTVKENITYGDPRQYIDLTEVIEVAKKADLHKSIISLSKVRPGVGVGGVGGCGGNGCVCWCTCRSCWLWWWCVYVGGNGSGDGDGGGGGVCVYILSLIHI